MLRINGYLEKAMPYLTPFGVAAGLLLGSRISAAAPAIVPLFAVITFSGALAMTAEEAVGVVRKPLPIILFLISFHVILPAAVRLAAGLFFSGDPDYITGFVLLFAIPTAVSGYIWTGIYRGNGPLALALILLDTLLAPFTVPATVSAFMGKNVSVDTGGMFLSLVWMVVLPSAAGVALNRLTKGAAPKAVGPVLKPLAKVFLVMVIAINVSRLEGKIPPFDAVFVGILAACALLSFGGFALGRLSSLAMGLSREDSVTLTFATGMRNISAALVLAIDFFPPRAAVPVVTGILLQQTLAALAGVGLIQKMDNRGHGRRPEARLP